MVAMMNETKRKRKRPEDKKSGVAVETTSVAMVRGKEGRVVNEKWCRGGHHPSKFQR
jgi:hypothetical protein